MKEKACDHLSFWQVYKIINFNRIFNRKKWFNFVCEKCHKKCDIVWKKSKKISFFVRVCSYFLWLFPALLLIISVILHYLDYKTAIVLITLFHFFAMYFIINSKYLVISSQKKS